MRDGVGGSTPSSTLGGWSGGGYITRFASFIIGFTSFVTRFTCFITATLLDLLHVRLGEPGVG